MKAQLKDKVETIDARDVSRFPIGKPQGQEEVFLRVGRYGPFVEQGERRASLPDEMPPDELTLQVALEMLDTAAKGDEPLGQDPETGRNVFVKSGRFGPYVQLEAASEDEKPKNASLLKGMEVDDINLEVALKLLSLPRTLGVNPDSEEKDEIVAHNGRYGPYVKCGSETRSLPADVSPIDVTLEKALELLRQPKQRRGRGAPKEPLKVFEKPSPVTENPVQLLDGRYGPYVTDGETNASLPKTMTVEEITFERAIDLLAERAAKGGSKKKAKKKAKKKTTKKKTTKKKAAKKTTKKKTTKKKTAAKKATKKKTT